MRIGILGLGYVGLTLGIAAADCGVEVYGIEINQQIKDCLKQNRAHFYEPGLDAMIRRVNGKRFFVVDEFPDQTEFDAFVITVGTPLKRGKSSRILIISKLRCVRFKRSIPEKSLSCCAVRYPLVRRERLCCLILKNYREYRSRSCWWQCVRNGRWKEKQWKS